MLAAARSAGISVSSDKGSLVNSFGKSATAGVTNSRLRIQVNERIAKFSVKPNFLLSKEWLHNSAMHIGESKIPTLILVDQPFMVDSQ